jgi:CRISPR-associated protein Cas1
MLDATKALMHPKASALHLVKDRISFVYLDHTRVTQDDTGVLAMFRSHGEPRKVYIPVSSVAVVMLGPGSSITSPAAATLARSGTVLLIAEAAGTRTLMWGHALASDARWAEAQASLWASPETRVSVAVQMYLRRFHELPPGPLTLERLRGLEGARVKELYGSLARRAGLPGWRRRWDENDEKWDPVNEALSAANACLYGVSLAAVSGIGALPQLGFIHGGAALSFVYDIADLYKAESSIPIAFACKDAAKPAAEARRRMREYFRTSRLLSRAVEDVQSLLGASSPNPKGLNTDSSDRVKDGVNWAWITGENTLSDATGIREVGSEGTQ